MHSHRSYPMKLEEVNLKVIKLYKKNLDVMLDTVDMKQQGI